MLNAFTVDVEDYFQVSGFEAQIPRTTWSDYPSRVVDSTSRLMDLLDRFQVRGTFFVLGWVADRFPALVERIHAAGHEIGSHGYWHRLIYRQSPDEFRADLVQSRNILEQITGVPVTAYRAPSFSVVKRSRWALSILADEGFLFDSSVFPVRHDRYGLPGARWQIHQIETTQGSLWEFPPSVLRLAGRRLPVGGGGYFRLYPWRLTQQAFQRINRSGHPFMFYVHPWEVDQQQPRLKAGSSLARFRHYVNLAGTYRKLERLLSDFSFGTMSEVLRQHWFGPTPAMPDGETSQPHVVLTPQQKS